MGETTTQQTDGLSLRSYAAVLLRWKWLIVATTVVAVALSAAYTLTRTPLYSATANLLYVTPVDIQDPLGQVYIDTTSQQAVLESVPTVIAGASVRKSAQADLSKEDLATGYTVSASLSTGANGYYSSVVGITGVSSSPETAAAAANAYAQAFIDWRRESAKSQVAKAIEVVKGRMGKLSSATSEYQALLNRLRDLELLEASVGGGFEVITLASPPGEPFWPSVFRNVVVALVVGLAGGIGLAFLLEQFDTRVHGEEEATRMLELPVLGHVPPPAKRERGKETDVLQTLSDPSGIAAEAYRVLRSNLDFMGIDGDVRTLMVTSSVQGEGKSVTICNLAVSMALAGKRVVLVDADLRGPRVHAYFRVPNAQGVSQVVARRVELDKAMLSLALNPSKRRADVAPAGSLTQAGPVRSLASAPVSKLISRGGSRTPSGDWQWPDEAGEAPVLRLLTSGALPPNPGEIVASRRFGDILEELAESADLVLVDAPAMLAVGDTAALASRVDALVYVVNPPMLRRPMLHRAKAQLAQLPCRKLGIVSVATRPVAGYYTYRAAESEGATTK